MKYKSRILALFMILLAVVDVVRVIQRNTLPVFLPLCIIIMYIIFYIWFKLENKEINAVNKRIKQEGITPENVKLYEEAILNKAKADRSILESGDTEKIDKTNLISLAGMYATIEKYEEAVQLINSIDIIPHKERFRFSELERYKIFYYYIMAIDINILVENCAECDRILEEAREYIDEFKGRHKDLVYGIFARYELIKKNYKAAKEYADKLKISGDKDMNASIYETFAYISYAMGNTEKAQQYYESALSYCKNEYLKGRVAKEFEKFKEELTKVSY